MNNQTKVLTASLERTGLKDSNFNLNDYTYKWYEVDIAVTQMVIIINMDTSYLDSATSFMHLTFKGCTIQQDWRGNITEGADNQTYFYLQGYSLTMGEGVKMEK